ncbi:hypothetical protein RND71_007951 [Anisodus tanguticus]|uniref:Uncharacterized protein n=1 Tax=Anisodus tanguticus TaxID=243964 RepID=A0AAE1SMJ1_9SOLA|nr:hypothetical protein RND71_007951 [Anisodus tanguticus]
MNASILAKWAMDASTIGEDAGSELLAVMRCLTAAIVTMKPRHELVRQDVAQVICSVCDTEQPVARVCTNCGVSMGEYFCEIDKGLFHCDDCGICRVGGRENYFHCKKCDTCYSVSLRNNHLCVEDSMRHHCPICYEFLFDSLKDTTVMKCGHTMHTECHHEMIKRDKSIIDMSKAWKQMDEEVGLNFNTGRTTSVLKGIGSQNSCIQVPTLKVKIPVLQIEETVMPEDLRYKKVWILCNDCNDTTEVFFHIIGQKCRHCQSYNTRMIAPPVLPQ